jgi:hypothetical protein
MAGQIEAMSGAELVEAARAVADRFGCFAWALAAVVGAVAAVVLEPADATLALSVAIALCLGWKLGRRYMPRVRFARLATEEFARRWWLEPLEVYEASAEERIGSGQADAVVLLIGRALPHGGHRAIRLELSGSDATAEARSTPFLEDLIAGADLARQIVLPETPVQAGDAARLSALLDSLTPERVVPPRTVVLDGFPCQISVLRRSREPLRATLNLAGSSEAIATHPVRELCALVLEIERAPSSQPPPPATEEPASPAASV